MLSSPGQNLSQQDASAAGQQKAAQARFLWDHDSQSTLPSGSGAPTIRHPRAGRPKPQTTFYARREPKTLLVLDEAESGPLPLGCVPTPLGQLYSARGLHLPLASVQRKGLHTRRHSLHSTQVRGNAAAAARGALWVRGTGKLGLRHCKLLSGAL